ncbi:hypothetical protein EON82_17755 [bacterium]|nr:MAG: hypothetical protein EON82_17755 [bacterium]
MGRALILVTVGLADYGIDLPDPTRKDVLEAIQALYEEHARIESLRVVMDHEDGTFVYWVDDSRSEVRDLAREIWEQMEGFR